MTPERALHIVYQYSPSKADLELAVAAKDTKETKRLDEYKTACEVLNKIVTKYRRVKDAMK